MTGSERVEVNRFLQRHGFAGLGDACLIPQLALAIEDEVTLKRVLNLTTPCERTACYEALRPYLRFVPRPLDVLLAEIALDAEIRQLPTIQPDGSLKAYTVPEVTGEDQGVPLALARTINPNDRVVVQTAVDKAVATGYLELVCARCTKHEQISAISRAFAEELAIERGWTSGDGDTMRCPECSQTLN